MPGLLFPASVIGSMPRPAFVKELIADDAQRSPEEYEHLMASAIRYVVALQEAAGLDVVTDGEWRRKSYIGVIAELAHGFELSSNPADGRPWTVVVDKLSPKQPGFITQEVRFLKQVTGRDIKATLPAPALLGERMWDERKSSRAIPPAKTSFAIACRFCAGKLSCCGMRVYRSCRLTTLIFACSSTRLCGQRMPTPIEPRTSLSIWTTRFSRESRE
jgi:5-methyltetrahydropteroyltriglutamate--homocysteine methyltransferase